MATRRTLRLKTHEQRELEQYRDHDARPYVRERCGAVLKIAAGATPHAVARQGLLKPRDPDTLYGWLEVYETEGLAGLVAHQHGGERRRSLRGARGRQDLLEPLRAGPGEATGEGGPAPSRWTLRTIRASVEWLTEYTLSGVWRVPHACGLGWHASCARLFSPDPASRGKVRRLHRCSRDAARHPDTVVALFLDEFGYQRWPEIAPTWGWEAAVAQRAGNNQL